MRKFLFLLAFFPAFAWGSYNPSTGGGGGATLPLPPGDTNYIQNTTTVETATTTVTGYINTNSEFRVSGNTFLTDMQGGDGGSSTFSTFVGNTGRSPSNGNAIQDVCVGKGACSALTTGQDTVAIGYQAGNAMTAGSTLQDTCIGSSSCLRATTSNKNSCIGYQSCFNLTTNAGGNNVAIGDQAMLTATTAANDTCIGFNCLDLLTNGSNDVGIGPATAADITTGSQNTCVGANSPSGFGQACSGVKTGSYNTMVGAGSNVGSTGNANQTNCTALGANVQIDNVAHTEIDNATCIGFGCVVASSNTMVLGGGPGVNAESVQIIGNTTNLYSLEISTSNVIWHVTVSTSGHLITNGGVSPTISACGTTPNGSVVGDDNEGIITVGGGAVTACTLTFSKTWGVSPVCVITDNSTASTGDISAISATAFTTSFSVSIGGGTIWYRCGCSGGSCL